MHLTKPLIFAVVAASFVLSASAGAPNVTVTVLGVAEGVLEAQAGAETFRLTVPAKKKWMTRGLAKGDKVAVSYEMDGSKRVLRSVEGDGVVIGTVVKIEKAFITVEAKDGVKHRLMPKWKGGMPKDGGGHDKEVLKQIHSVKVGQRVQLTWTIEEGKRVTGVKALGSEKE